MRKGRQFLDMDEDAIKDLFTTYDEVSIKKLWLTTDVRKTRDTKWLNVVVEKK